MDAQCPDAGGADEAFPEERGAGRPEAIEGSRADQEFEFVRGRMQGFMEGGQASERAVPDDVAGQGLPQT